MTQKQAVMGVKGHSIFVKLTYPFDLVNSFAVDWKHCNCLGVIKYSMWLLVRYFFKNDVKFPYKITYKKKRM